MRRAPRGVPRDEWLLAGALAWNPKPDGFASTIGHAVADCPGPLRDVERSGFMGAYSVIYGRESTLYDTVEDLDAYAAGAAVALSWQDA